MAGSSRGGIAAGLLRSGGPDSARESNPVCQTGRRQGNGTESRILPSRGFMKERQIQLSEIDPTAAELNQWIPFWYTKDRRYLWFTRERILWLLSREKF